MAHFLLQLQYEIFCPVLFIVMEASLPIVLNITENDSVWKKMLCARSLERNLEHIVYWMLAAT